MAESPKLIILNGFAGSGKSTIAKRYIENHPFAINIEGDNLISMIGQWKGNYDKARETIFPLTKAMAKTYLSLGHDVIVPYLLTDPEHAGEFEKLAKETHAKFFEVLLSVNKNEAIHRLMKRGTWGEEGLPQLTDKDLPEINNLFDSMEKATARRSKTISIKVEYENIDDTYNRLINALK